MEAYYFIYTRFHDVDYQSIYFPSEQQCPWQEVFYKFRDLARGIINTDYYKIDLSKPIWLMSKLHGYTLWGVGIANAILDPDHSSDRVGRSIRGFFGLIIKGDPQSLPYDIQFFKHLYDSLIVPNWNADENNSYHQGLVCDVDFSQYSTITAEDYGIALNTSPNKTLIIGDVDVKKALSQALYLPNAGIVVGLQEEAHAFSDMYKYPNVWIEGHERSEFTYPVVKEENGTGSTGGTQPGNPWLGPNTNGGTAGGLQGGGEAEPKKEFGSKMVKRAIVFLAILLAVILTIKKCHSNKTHSSSRTAIEQPQDTTNQQ